MRLPNLLIILMLAGAALGQNIVSPVFVHKDGDASAIAKSGSDKDLYVDGGSRQNVGWLTFQMQGLDVSKISQAKLVLYIRSVGSSGTLQVRSLTKDITAPENNVKLSLIVADPVSLATQPVGTSDIEKMLVLDITSAVKCGSFKGLALLSDDGLAVAFDSKEGVLAPMIQLTTAVDDVAAKWLTGVSAPAATIGKPGDLYLDIGSGDVYKRDTVLWTAITNIIGPRGGIGMQGVKGDKGDSGVAGPMGPKGDTGVAGPSGIAGAQGPAGEKGDKGDPGAIGPMGPKGDAGEAGPAGATGLPGVPGAQGPAGTAGPAAFVWQAVATPVQQAVPNAGYILNSSEKVNVSLPTAPAIGDLVKVTGAGSGGWQMQAPAGQSIDVFALPGLVAWTPRESKRIWWAITSSADFSRIAAVVPNDNIYMSTDGGVNWAPRDSVRLWISITSSADGTRLAAGVWAGKIYISTDGGITWAPRASDRVWTSIASSSDGMRLAAVDGDPDVGGKIYISSDGGENWTATGGSDRFWQGIASSSDGLRLAAIVNGGQIYTSSDGGTTWTAHEPNRNWWAISSSADGMKLAAVESGGQIYTSFDGGTTWTGRESNRGWGGICISSDGMRIAAVADGSQIFTSADAGVSWTPRNADGAWTSIACSSDGKQLAAAGWGDNIYTSGPYTGTLQSVTGTAGSSAEVQFVDTNKYILLNKSGDVTCP